MSEGVLGSTSRLWIEDSVGAGTYTLVEQTENVDDGLSNDSDEITNADSSQKKEHILTSQGLEVSTSLIQLPEASFSGSGQEKLRNAARNMTEGLNFRVVSDIETETFKGTAGDWSTTATTDAAKRISSTITRTGDSTIT